MTFSDSSRVVTAQDVSFDDDSLVVALSDGRKIAVPLAWFPRLLHASAAQRSNWELLGAGEGVHWAEIDEDVSVQGLLAGLPSIDVRPRRKAG